jgi:hypothetical protein
MFAGLPGIGVGTLFYVLIALCMPLVELVNVARGTSSIERWRRIGRQFFHAISIVFSIMMGERVMLYLLGQAPLEALNPTRMLHRGLAAQAGTASILAAPIMASILIVGAILLTVETMYLLKVLRSKQQARDAEADPVFNQALNTPPGN